MVGKLFVVYDRPEDTANDQEVLLTTEDAQEALAFAQEHKGVVYMYDVAANGNLLNETIMYIEDTLA
jgi:hypothetical protein